MPTTKPTRFFRISSPFIANENGREVPYVDKTEIFTDEHPALTKYAGNFVEVFPQTGRAEKPVETATAEPGEKRTTAR